MSRIDVARVRQDHPLARVAGAVVKLRSIAGELRGCCPFHADRSPSFYVFAGGDRWHCFGCGLTGDVLDFVQRLYSLSLREAAERLYSGDLPMVETPRFDAKPKADTRAAAGRIVAESLPIDGTPAETYLRSRGISMALPHTLRFARLAPPRHSGVLTSNGPGHLPALIAIATDADGVLVGLQRTYLTDDGRKAVSADGKVKFSLGHIAGGAVQLGPPAETLIVCEGLEDGLTLAQETGQSVWVAAGTSMLPRMILPDVVQSVVIAADNDEAGDKAARLAGAAFMATGRSVRIMRPTPPHKDFNAQLQEARA